MKRIVAIVALALFAAPLAEAADYVIRLGTQTSLDSVLARYPGRWLGTIANKRVHLVRFADPAPPLSDLQAFPGVVYAEPNVELHAPECLQSSIWFQGFAPEPRQ